jgi:hypothetical protein
MKVSFVILLLMVTSFVTRAQNGYIKFNKHQKVEGFVTVYNNTHVHEHQIELRLTEDDAKPKRYHKKDIEEYAIKGDTFRILKKFYPYEVEEIFYELIDAKVLISGKVSLLQIHNSYTTLDKGLFATYHEASPSQVPYFYVLQDAEGNYKRGVPSKKDKLKPLLEEFFSDEVIAEYEKVHGHIHYKDLDKFVRFGNQKLASN